jgi:hypothetical protein
MSQELSHPGHVGLVRKQVELNRQRIVDAVVPPKGFTGDQMVTWIENLLSQHHTLCQQEHDRNSQYEVRWTND